MGPGHQRTSLRSSIPGRKAHLVARRVAGKPDCIPGESRHDDRADSSALLPEIRADRRRTGRPAGGLPDVRRDGGRVTCPHSTRLSRSLRPRVSGVGSGRPGRRPGDRRQGSSCSRWRFSLCRSSPPARHAVYFARASLFPPPIAVGFPVATRFRPAFAAQVTERRRSASFKEGRAVLRGGSRYPATIVERSRWAENTSPSHSTRRLRVGRW